MTTPSNDSSTSPADESATASSPGSGNGDFDVQSTEGMAAGSEGTAAGAGYIDDDQLSEELRPDAEGMTESDGSGERTLAEGATQDTGQLPDPAQSSPADQPDVSEPS